MIFALLGFSSATARGQSWDVNNSLPCTPAKLVFVFRQPCNKLPKEQGSEAMFRLIENESVCVSIKNDLFRLHKWLCLGYVCEILVRH